MGIFLILSTLAFLGYYLNKHLCHLEEKIDELAYLVNDDIEDQNAIKELPKTTTKSATKRKK